jgi:hypothetical protein
MRKTFLFFLSERQGRDMNDLKGRITKLEADNQELKQMTTKVCFYEQKK